VLIVGAGPSGLSAAYHLRRLGHWVKIVEAGPRAGGMMRFGIPQYRLPRDVLDAEIQRILDLGVELTLDCKVTNVLDTMKAAGFDAAFLAVGAHIAKRRLHTRPVKPRTCSTRYRCCAAWKARTSRCSAAGSWCTAAATPALDVRAHGQAAGRHRIDHRLPPHPRKMPAHDFEVEEGLAGRRPDQWLSTIKNMGDEGTLTVEKMALDEKGFPQPTGEVETLEADSLVLALGQDVDLSLLEGVPGLAIKDGTVQVGPNMMTGYAGIFAGGDMVPSERTVTVGVGHGKKAARHIDAWLRGTVFAPPPKHELATFDKMNPWYYSDAPKTVRPMLELARRTSTFDEVVSGLDESNALFEAAAASPAATASSATTVTACAPTTP
jgi:hypothetical protein